MEMQKQKYVVTETWGDALCYQQEYDNLSDAAKDYATRDLFLYRSITDADGSKIAGTVWSKNGEFEGEFFSSDLLEKAVVEHERAISVDQQPAIVSNAPTPGALNTQLPGLDQDTQDRLAARRALDRKQAQELLGQNTIYQDEIATVKFRARESNPTERARKNAAENSAPPNTNKDQQAVPPEIERQYLRVGNKYFHPKNKDTMVFEDKGHKLETKLSGEQIAMSMVAIAAARGWDDIKISGTEAFRKEVWLVAAARGMRIKGYIPSELDKAELAKRMQGIETNRISRNVTRADALDAAAQQAARAVAIPVTNRQAQAHEGMVTRGQREEADALDAAAQQAAYEQSQQGGNNTSTVPTDNQDLKAGAHLVEHGPAPYMHDKNNSASYFVTTRHNGGDEKTTWGIDLERGISESGAQLGDVITLQNEGRKPVTVTEYVRDKDGNIVDSHEKITHRNSWNVTNVSRAEAFKSESPEESVKKHPELAGAHAALAAIERKAEADGLSAQQRAVVRARAQQNIVNSIERGDLPEIKINEEKTLRREKTKEQQQSL